MLRQIRGRKSIYTVKQELENNRWRVVVSDPTANWRMRPASEKKTRCVRRGRTVDQPEHRPTENAQNCNCAAMKT